MSPYTSKVKPRKAAKTKKVKPTPPKGNPSSDAAKREKAAKPKSKPVVKKVAKKVVKATAKKAVVPPVSTGLIKTIGRIATRVVAPVALAVGALPLVDPVMRRLFPKSKPWKSTPKLRASQKRMNKAMGYGRDPEMEIHGGGSLLGLQVDEAKKAVLPTTMPSPVPRPPTKKKESTLGKTKPRLTRPKKEVYTTELRIPPKLSKIKDMGKVEDTRAKKPSTSKTDPTSTDGPSPAPKRLNENASPTKGKTDIKNRFDKFMQDSSRADRHLGAPKKKPLGMEDAFWDGSSWVR